MDNWIYFGVFLDKNSKIKILDVIKQHKVNIPTDWKLFCHHMTIAFNNGSDLSKQLLKHYERHLNKSMTLVINGIGISDDAIAVRVKYDGPIANKIPHITIATPKNGKPVNSNYITQWIDIKPYNISGTFEQFAK
jgi:hypothetical protein